MVQPISGSPVHSPSAPDDFLGFTIVRLGHVLQKRMDAALIREVGVSVRQFGALNYLVQDPGMGSAALARKLLITPQSTGPLVDELARRGYLERDYQARAGTPKRATLTPAGNALLQRGYAVAKRLQTEERMLLPREVAETINRALLDLLDKLEGGQ